MTEATIMTEPPSRPIAAFVRPGSFPISRVVRNLRVAKSNGYDPVYIGAARDASLPKFDTWEGFPIERVGISYALLGGKRAWLYLFGVLTFALAANRRLFQLKPAVVHGSDVEGMLGCLLYRFVYRRTTLLFNVHDNMPQRYRCPAFAKACLRVFEGLIARCADRVVLPDARRVEAMGRWAPEDPVLVPNTPEDPGKPSDPPAAGRVRLLLVGWLDWRRGVETAKDLLESSDAIELVVAGDGPPDVVEAIRSFPRTTYHGFVTHERVFELAADCHAFLALYDPACEINRNASPNKVGDALALGRPVIINSEVAVAASLIAADCAITVPYDRTDQLATAIDRELRTPFRLAQLCRNARRHYEQVYDWERFRPAVESLFPSTPARRQTRPDAA